MTGVTVEKEIRDRDGEQMTVLTLGVELPEDVVEEARNQAGEIDPDHVTDRIEVEAFVDGEPV